LAFFFAGLATHLDYKILLKIDFVNKLKKYFEKIVK
jgi:hypothetical protein